MNTWETMKKNEGLFISLFIAFAYTIVINNPPTLWTRWAGMLIIVGVAGYLGGTRDKLYSLLIKHYNPINEVEK